MCACRARVQTLFKLCTLLQTLCVWHIGSLFCTFLEFTLNAPVQLNEDHVMCIGRANPGWQFFQEHGADISDLPEHVSHKCSSLPSRPPNRGKCLLYDLSNQLFPRFCISCWSVVPAGMPSYRKPVRVGNVRQRPCCVQAVQIDYESASDPLSWVPRLERRASLDLCDWRWPSLLNGSSK